MKKASSKNIMTGLGVAMAIGSAATLIGGSMMSKNPTMTSMKKSAEKAIKNFGSYLGSM
ncbi:MAG: hypothetical protein J6L89_03615 [Clostridia bacterium]|nr:hypothetical protein [Clostridia bacterium]